MQLGLDSGRFHMLGSTNEKADDLGVQDLGSCGHVTFPPSNYSKLVSADWSRTVVYD